MALPVVAALGVGAAAYLNAKLHLGKDIGDMLEFRRTENAYAKAVKNHRESGFYAFETAASTFPEVTSIWSRTGVYTWQETYNRTCQYASFFLSLGVRPGQMVALYMQNAPEFVFSWLGLWAIGCAPAMINWSLGRDPLIHCVRMSGAKVLILDEEEECQSRVQQEKDRLKEGLGIKIITLSQGLKAEIAGLNISRPGDEYRKDVFGESPGALIYTSGTTGLPKAFPFPMIRFRKTGLAETVSFSKRTGPNGDRYYDCMPMYHGTGGVIAMGAIQSGISLAIGKRFSLSNFWADVRDSKATFFIYVGETCRYLLTAPPSPLDKQHSLKGMHGNGLRPDVWQKFRERFGVEEVLEFFASTEGMFTLGVHAKGDFQANCVGHHGFIVRQMLHNTYVPVEYDLETNDIWRCPTTGFAKRNTYEEGGEILVKVPDESAWPGYWNSSEATAKKFVRDVFVKGDLYYRTGDSLRRDRDGRWFFMDRLGDTFRWKGQNVSTAEVAEILGRFPGISEANVYGVLLPSHDGRAGCAAITLETSRKESNFDWAGFAKYATKHLPKYAVPVFVRVVHGGVQEMGTHNNKQNKVFLRAEGVDPRLKGTKTNGHMDEFYWRPPRSSEFVTFRQQEWDSLMGGQARL